MIFRTATDEDAAQFYGGVPVRSFRGVCAVKGDAVVGIGGIYHDSGYAIAFTEFSDMTVRERAKGAREMVRFLDSLPFPVYAFAQPDFETSGVLLRKLGFEPTGLFGPGGEMLRRG